MSTNPLDMPVLISQLPNLQQVMGPHLMAHEAQLALFGQMVAENQRKEEQTVQVVEKEDGLDAMGRDTGGNKNAQHHAARQRQQPAPEPEADGTGQSSNASPWSGNIINVTI